MPFQVSQGMEVELPRCSQAGPSAVLGRYLVHEAGFVSSAVHQDLPGHSGCVHYHTHNPNHFPDSEADALKHATCVARNQ